MAIFKRKKKFPTYDFTNVPEHPQISLDVGKVFEDERFGKVFITDIMLDGITSFHTGEDTTLTVSFTVLPR